MDPSHLLWVTIAIGVVAMLYSSVGHGGASGYLAVMALASWTPAQMKPTALVLNIAVSALAAWMFWRAGFFSVRIFLPLAVASVPMAFLGGHWTAPSPLFHWLIALTLMVAAGGLVFRVPPREEPLRVPSILILIIIGAILGFLSGLIGVGGGIFLTPLLLFLGWCQPKTAAAVSAAFILVNSTAGLAGNPASVAHLPAGIFWLFGTVLIAGFLGAAWGSGRAPNVRICQSLALVLMIAATKMLLTI